MFWPVFYVTIFAVIYVVVRGHSPRTTLCLLAVALVIQVTDTRAGWAGTGNFLMVPPASAKTALVDPFWQSAASHYQKVRWVRPQNYSPNWLALADYASSHRLATGKYDVDSLYILDERALLQAAISIDANTDLLAQIDGLNILAPGWKQCADCLQMSATNPLKLIPLLKQGEDGRKLAIGLQALTVR